MPNRLVGARARFIEKLRERSATGRIKEMRNGDLIVAWDTPLDPPMGGNVDIVTFANTFEYSCQTSCLGGDTKRAVFRPISEIREMPMSKSLKLLAEDVNVLVSLGESQFKIKIVAIGKDAFAFESKDILPMDDSTKFFIEATEIQIPLDAELILQRFEAGKYRGLASVRSFTRLADMHWHRLMQSS